MKPTSTGIIAAALLILVCAGSASAWYGEHSYRLPLSIDNTGGSSLTNYQLSVSLSGINADSIRVVNEPAGTTIPHWCANVTGGNCYDVWFNVPALSGGVWTNETYYIYYGSATVCTADYSDTFTKAHNMTGLVLELCMDDGTGNTITVDGSGEGNDGTLTLMDTVGSATSGWQGTDGGQWDGESGIHFDTGDHLRFDGTNDYVDCGDGIGMHPASGKLTISFWYNWSGTAQLGGLVTKGTTTSRPYGIYTDFRSGHSEYKLSKWKSSGYDLVTISGTTVSDNEWRHIVWAIDGTSSEFYVDGESVGTQSWTDAGFGTDTATDVLIGKLSTLHFSGAVDDVLIYNRTLNDDEVYRTYIRSKYATPHPSTSLRAVEVWAGLPGLEGWQALGEDAMEGYIDFVMFISIATLIIVVGGILIGLRSFVGDVSPEVVIVIAVSIGIGLLILVTMTEIIPSAMEPMAHITMEER